MNDISLNRDALKGQRVIVVGAGIAGLTAAFRLKQLGCDVMVLEQQPHAGGRMTTVKRQGYRIDVAASVLSTSYKQMLVLAKDAGLSPQIQATNDVLAVYREGEIHRLPGLSLQSLLRTSLLSTGAKLGLLRLLPDLLRARKDKFWYDLSEGHRMDIESVWAFASRSAPPEIAEYLLDPMCRSIYLAPSEEVSRLPLLFFLAIMAGQSFFSSAEGVGFLTSGLARQLPIEYRATVTSVEERADGVRVHWSRPGKPDREEEAAAVIVALPATCVPSILQGLSSSQQDFLRSTIYSPTMVISLGLGVAPPDEEAMWLNIPRRYSDDMNAIVLDHNKAPGRAPAGKGLITTFWMREWSKQRWEMDDEKLGHEAFAKAKQFLPTMKDDVDLVDIRRLDVGASVRAPGGYKALAKFVAEYSHSRVQLAGDYFTSISTNGSLCSGERAATKTAQFLSTVKSKKG